MNVSLLYRGPLASCNYDCSYCPFAKRIDPREALRADETALLRFVEWIERRQEDRISVLFTPWGEGLVRAWYREAMVRLSRCSNVAKAAIQTNLSCSVGWLADCDPSKVALWCTFHPSQTSRASFVRRCGRLDAIGVRYSVGCVGVREEVEEIKALRRELAPHVYLWVNAIKRPSDYYDAATRQAIVDVDPLFPLNLRAHPSRGLDCRTGTDVFSVDGDGTLTRCHFVKNVVGNLYRDPFRWPQVERACPNADCGCHIGYVHLETLGLHDVFRDGVLERIPSRLPPNSLQADANIERVAEASTFPSESR